MPRKPKKIERQEPLPARLIPLNERELRFGPQWRIVALLADQALELAYRWPGSITARRAMEQYRDALKGVEIHHAALWGTATSRDAVDARRAAEEEEAYWLPRNGAIGR